MRPFLSALTVALTIRRGDHDLICSVFESIGLGYELDDLTDQNGNLWRYRGFVYIKTNEDRDARVRPVYDIGLVVQ